ncbi:MAG: methyltransferase [bacterium]|nr:methyltransferase [bacterium]
MERTLAGRDRANRMFDAYGALLTAQQQHLLRRYYQDDLSLGEIAADLRVTRQAVHDGLRRALVAMERLEGALGLAARQDHYSTPAPRSTPKTREQRVELRGRVWAFQSVSGVFAHRRFDAGTHLLIDAIEVRRDDRILDLGCGYGAVGLVAAALATRGRVWLVDLNRRAAWMAHVNAAAHGLTNVCVLVGDGAAPFRDGSVDLVVTNPPIRAGRRVVTEFIEGAWRVLRPGGRFYMVVRTAQGALTLARLVAGRFGEARQVRAAEGYRVYEARRKHDAKAKVIVGV